MLELLSTSRGTSVGIFTLSDRPALSGSGHLWVMPWMCNCACHFSSDLTGPNHLISASRSRHPHTHSKHAYNFMRCRIFIFYFLVLAMVTKEPLHIPGNHGCQNTIATTTSKITFHVYIGTVSASDSALVRLPAKLHTVHGQ